MSKETTNNLSHQETDPKLLALQDLIQFSIMFANVLETGELCKNTNLSRDKAILDTLEGMMNHLYQMIRESFGFCCGMTHLLENKSFSDLLRGISVNNNYRDMFNLEWYKYIYKERILFHGEHEVMRGFAIPFDYVEIRENHISYTDSEKPRVVFIPLSRFIETGTIIGEIRDDDNVNLIPGKLF